MTSTRPQTEASDKRPVPTTTGGSKPEDNRPDQGDDIGDEGGPLATEFGTKEAAESMTSEKFKGD